MAEKHSENDIDNEKLLDRLNEKAKKCISISISPVQMTSSKHSLLYCQANNLYLLDEQAEERMKMMLKFDVNDICWSSSLKRFLALSNKELYSLNLDTKEVTLVNTFNNIWSQLTVHDNTVIVSIDNYGANMEVYNLSDWKLLKRFEPPLSVNDNQYTTQLQFSSSGTKLAVTLTSRDQLFFQLRNPDNMNILHNVDLAYFSGCTSYHMFPLPNDEFLVNPVLENHISLIDSNGKIKKTISYKEGGIVSATLINDDSKYLVLQVGILVETQMDDYYKYELHFFDLQ